MIYSLFLLDRDKTLRLSKSQKEVFNGWKRPDELVKNFYNETFTSAQATTAAKDLVQDITTDCSVVASLCAATARSERDHNCVCHAF